MARTSLQNIQSLPDPLMSYNFDITIPTMPGTPDSRNITYKAQTTSIPGFMMDSVPVALHGVEFRYAGRENTSHQLEVTILETRDMGTRAAFLAWRRIARDNLTNSGSYKTVYSVTLVLDLYDDTGAIIRTINLVGAWPEQVGDSSLDGGQSSAVTTSVTFSYDYPVEA